MIIIKCKLCKKEKDESNFRTYHNRRNTSCESCISQKRKDWINDKNGIRTKAYKYYHLNKDRISKYRSIHRLKRKYSLTIDEFNSLLEKQKHNCAICSCSFNEKKPCVDHDHKSGKIRGLLCRNCNLDLQVIEKVTFVKNAQKYLESMK